MNFGKTELEQACRDHPESEMARVFLSHFHHFEKIYEVIDGQWEIDRDSYLFNGVEYKWQRETLRKQEALFNVAKKSTKVLEMGAYLGHSSLVMLIANPSLTITCIDQDVSHKVIDYLNREFNHRILYLPESAIPILIQRNESYDLVHFDNHRNHDIRQQYTLSKSVMSQNSYILFDHYEKYKNIIDLLIQQDELISVTTPGCPQTNIVLQKTTTTFVSAFLTNVNQRKDQSIHNYIEYGRSFIQSKVNKIIFIDHTLYDTFRTYLSNPYTFYLPYQKEDMYFYKEYTDQDFDQFSLHTKRPDKDTKEYIFTMCHKTEFVRKAMEKNPFETKNEQYMWIDFGLNYVCKMNDDEFSSSLVKCSQHRYQTIRIGSIWNLDMTYTFDVYSDIIWYFAGGVFGGNKHKMIEFADRVKKKIDDVVKERHSLMWEVNIWWMVYKECKELFLPYPSNHNASIIKNYVNM